MEKALQDALHKAEGLRFDFNHPQKIDWISEQQVRQRKTFSPTYFEKDSGISYKK
ncbi:hypothetical protein MHI48_16485 [Paenibacillus sp. FSL H7-0942]|uniref:hypothetical protein n=1 Tax=Paenibacillus sp. FSL H7-0942 TaxID=2921444 RepID=UPI0032487DB3